MVSRGKMFEISNELQCSLVHQYESPIWESLCESRFCVDIQVVEDQMYLR